MSKRTTTKSGTPKARQEDDQTDDLVLWERVASSVKPIKSKRYAQNLAVASGSAVSSVSGPKAGRVAKLGKTKLGAAPVAALPPAKSIAPIDLRAGEHAGLDKSTRRKLFRGDVPVTRQLDLHGMTAARAENRITGFIQESAHIGHRCVLIITGKGTRGDGVLRRHVPIWLKKPSLASAVLAIAEARPSDGGAGALYVLLRRNRDKS